MLAAVLLVAVILPCAAKADYASKLIDKTLTQEALDRIPPALQGKSFGLYYKGTAAELIKERLQKLGYYPRLSTFHDKFDELLRTRLRKFQRNNGVEESGAVDEATLCALYAQNPVMGEWYTGDQPEPQCALIIPITSSAQWYRRAEDEIGFRVTVKNVSDQRTVIAYEVSMRAVNDRGETVHETEKLVMTGKIEPMKSAWTDYVNMTDADEIQAVYVSLRRVRYADSTYFIVEDPDQDCFELREKRTEEMGSSEN